MAVSKLHTSSVYGPVKSWRLGRSLGIDLLCVDSICSFDCVYCQLGKINRLTSTRSKFITTEKVMADLKASDWKRSDVITISGSGEPTLASNLGDVIAAVKDLTGKPVIVLTNSTMLSDPSVRSELLRADRIYCKLDAWSDDQLRRVNRPVDQISHETIVEGIAALRKEYKGFLAVQTMILTPLKWHDIERYAKIIQKIAPDEVQLNIPSRPVPNKFETQNRGNRVDGDEDSHSLKIVPPAHLLMIADAIETQTLVPVITPPSITRHAAELSQS